MKSSILKFLDVLDPLGPFLDDFYLLDPISVYQSCILMRFARGRGIKGLT